MQFRKYKKAVFLIILSLAVMSFSACSSSSENDKGDEDTGTYTAADPVGDWGYPTPYHHYQRGPGYVRMSFIFDTLVWKDEDGFIPGLAENWTYLSEQEAYQFELHDNIKWHDGEKLTANDVAFTFSYMEKHPYAWVDTERVREVEVINDLEFIIYLKDSYAPFLNNIAGVLPIIPEHIWSEVDDPENFLEEDAVIGSGPFKLEDYSKEHGTYLYEANEDYYLGSLKVDTLKFLKVSEQMSPAALDRGEVNFSQLPAELTEEISGKNIEIIKGSYDWNAKLMFNHEKDPFSSKKFRQAIAFAVDTEEIVNTARRGYAIPGSPGLIPPGSDWYNSEVEEYTFDPDRAAQMLKELGYEQVDGGLGKNGTPLELELLVKPGDERTAELIKRQLEDIGVKVRLAGLEDKTVDSRILNWNFDFALSGHGGLGGDPNILNMMILHEGINSARYYNNEELTNLLREQLMEMNREKREQMVYKIQELYAEDLPCLTLYYPENYWAHDGTIDFFMTQGGIGLGVPLPLNKIAFIY